jgi:hypothetical protein
MKFFPGTRQIEVVEDRIAPDGIECAVAERQILGIRFLTFNAHAIRRRPLLGLPYVPGGKVECGNIRPPAGEDDGRHPVPATVVEDLFSVNAPEPGERRANPRFVVEVVGVGEA